MWHLLPIVTLLMVLSALHAWAGPAIPERAEVVFSDDFETGQAKDWSGGKAISDPPADSKGALAATAKDLVLARNVKFTSAELTFCTFRYYADGCYSFGVQFADATRGDNFKTFIVPLAQKTWTTVTFNITVDIQSSANHVEGIKPGDVLQNMTLWPMEKLPGAKFWLDDMAIYTLTPAARAVRVASDLQQARKDFEPVAKPFEGDLGRLEKDAAGIAGPDDAAKVAELEQKAQELGDRMKRASLQLTMQQVHALASAEYVVGIESPLVRVSDRNRSLEFAGKVDKACALAAAANEYENVQLVVIPVTKDLEKIAVSFTDLTGPGGSIKSENLQWRIAEDVKTKPSYGYPRGLHGWKPDPLLPGAPFDLAVGRCKPLWVTVYVPPSAKCGEYAGTVTIQPANSHPVKVALNLRVWNYAIPLRGRFRHMCQFNPQSNQKRRENYAYLMQYRLSPTAQYSRSCSPVAEDVQFCLDRGITTFVAGNHPGPEINTAVVKPYYEALKAAGCLDLAVIYVGDEGTSPEALRQFREKALTVKREFPGLRVMVGGSTPRKELLGYIDVWDPIVSMNAGPGQGYQYNQQACDEALARREEVLWYMAGVRPPYTCIELDPPTPSLRMWPWVTWKYGVQGWEVYGTQGGWDKDINKQWPKTVWDTYTWRNYNGSGQFFYPGPDGVPLASIRIENARDGIEDYESLALLKLAIEAAASGKVKVEPALLDNARAIVSVRPAMLTHMWDWSRAPATIEAGRRELSQTLDELVGLIGREEFDAKVAAAAKAERAANNAAYEQRLKAFLAAQSASQSQPAGDKAEK